MANNFPHPERVLVIVAHPDDPEFGVAGTCAVWAAQGAEVTYVIVTDGSKGSAEEDMTREKLIEVREAEQRQAAEAVGVSNLVFLRQPDGEVSNTYELREKLVRQIRKYKPDVIVTHDPSTRIFRDSYLNHRDHRVVGDTTLDAIFPLARDRLNFPEHEAEGLAPHKVLDVFLIFSDQPNYWVDITTTVEQKIKSLQAHKSQIGDLEELAKRIYERTQAVAEHVSFEYGEAFRRVQLRR
jgi:LmbE family N-acetylglucosaminyl deacetylase